jgi:hypothetical protein
MFAIGEWAQSLGNYLGLNKRQREDTEEPSSVEPAAKKARREETSSSQTPPVRRSARLSQKKVLDNVIDILPEDILISIFQVRMDAQWSINFALTCKRVRFFSLQ